jgi:hypothetical protein
MSTSPPNCTEFLHSPGAHLPDLQELHSHMAKGESHCIIFNIESQLRY